MRVHVMRDNYVRCYLLTTKHWMGKCVFFIGWIPKEEYKNWIAAIERARAKHTIGFVTNPLMSLVWVKLLL